MMRKVIVLGVALILSFVLCSVSEAANLKKGIIGKWIDVKTGDQIEFLQDGTVIFASMVGDYRFIDDNRIRLDIKGAFGGIREVSIDKEGGLNLKKPNGKKSDRFLTEKAYKAYKAKFDKMKAEEAKRRPEEMRKAPAELEKSMVFVKGGCFQMGDTFGDGESYERPVHEACVDDLYIGKYEVTQIQWEAIMGSNPSYFKDCGDNCPVEQVSWDDIQEYINKLNQKNAGAGLKPASAFRLPTEAEWEYVARSRGKSEKYSGGNDLDSVAWYYNNSGSKTHPVGQKQPNGLGIYDMSGNVWEWVNDWYGDNYYENSPRNNPTGANSGQYRMLRGGSWFDRPQVLRVAYRIRNGPAERGFLNYGFRLVSPVSPAP